MPRVISGLLVGLGLLGVTVFVAAKPPLPGKSGSEENAPIRLHNGWMISPAGKHAFLGDMPVGSALSPDQKTLAVVNGGAAANALNLIDVATGEIRQTETLSRAQLSGVAWSKDGSTLYVSGGNSSQIHVFSVVDGKAQAKESLTVPDLYKLNEAAEPGSGKTPGYLSGLELSADGSTLYVTNLTTDSVYALSLPDGKIKAKRQVGADARPAAPRLSPDGKTLYVPLWGKLQVLALNPETLETEKSFVVGAHPNTVLLTRDGKRMFVSCGNSDAVYVVNTEDGQTSERIAMSLTPNAPAGATPSALALSPDEETLFVVNSDNNCVAVVEVETPGRSTVKGFIPTAWYPTMVTVAPDGKRLFIGSGKGLGTGPNGSPEGGKIDPVAPKGYPYIVTLFKGVVSTVEIPDARKLAEYTRQVYANCPYTADTLKVQPNNAPKAGSNAVPSKVGDPSPIKHVLYIIKENRTYDQVFGDMTDKNGKKIGNGDPNLCLFPEKVTPNHHALAREFVLLDNIYCDGEVSVDGHHWSNGAYVPDAMQRTWPAQYGGKGGPPIRYGDFGDPLAETPAGRIWDVIEKAGKTYRTYYYHVEKNRDEEWAKARAARERDYLAADLFVKDVEEWDKNGQMPNFMVMALSEDHTSGTRPGAFTPQACVASNDLGLGKIVEACAKSRYWKEMVIFVIEDDAQNGPDHVDAHRTVALAISPYTRRGAVDSTFYTTSSVLRTIELLMGANPMSMYDAAATPLYSSFTNKANLNPYKCREAQIDLNAKNASTAYGATRSLAFDFSEPDLLTPADEDALNRILWHSIKGEDAPYPGIVRRALFAPEGRPINTTESEEEEKEERTKKVKATKEEKR
ncbi:MAG: alkaline phosphatase family protein [Armatimonadaceae bacterium]